MTDDAQLALREIVVKNTEKVRFCLICNYVSKIIPQLKSRFSSFRFTPLKEDDIITRIKVISLQENIEYDDYSLRLINKISKGDFRKYINIFQSVCLQNKKITKSNIHQCIGYPSDEITNQIINNLLYEKNLSENYQLITDYLDHNYHFEHIIDSIVNNISNYQLSNVFLIKIIKKLSEIQINNSVDTKLKISNLIMCFLNVNNN
jgi:DNA polymerase III delta prime subunit